MTAPGLVVVGAGLAGLRAVEAARKTGYQGQVTLIGAESHLPYDRPPLSKEILEADAEPAPTTFKQAEEFDYLGIELRLDTMATGLDTDAAELVIGEERLPYEGLVLTTGAVARLLPHDDLPGVHELRTVEDALDIRRGLDTAESVVVVGGGFIGSEVASAARKRGLDVTIVEAAPMPLVRAVGEELAAVCAGLHGRHGTDLRCGVSVDGFEGDDKVKRVMLSDGATLAADLVVVGIGADPSTAWLEGSGLTIDDGVVCDDKLCAGPSSVFVAGDLARWRNPLFDRLMRLEHWTSSAEQGAAAGRNAANPEEATSYATVPYFWSDWYDHRLQMVGIPAAGEVLLLGNRESERWMALYREEDHFVGALGLNMQSKIMKLRGLIKRQAPWSEAMEFCDDKLQDLM